MAKKEEKAEEPGTEVRDWKKEMAGAAKKVAEAERPETSFISLKAGIMTYQDQPLPQNQIECIIVASSFARTCFDRPYDADDKEPPECFANAIDKMDLAPHPNVVKPFSGQCGEKTCDMAVFGSALQGKGPRCKTRRKLILMPVSGLKDPAKAELAMLACPPTSGGNYSGYASKVASGAGLPPWAVKTIIKCQPHPKNSFEVVFEAMGAVDDDAALAGIHSRIEEGERMLLQPYTYDQEEKKEEDSTKY